MRQERPRYEICYHVLLKKAFYFEPSNLDKCTLPKSLGMCFGHIQRYYYNQTSKACEEFYYGGIPIQLLSFIN